MMLKFDLSKADALKLLFDHGYVKFHEYSEAGDAGPRSREYYITSDERRYPGNKVCPEGNLMRAEISKIGTKWAASIPGV